MWTDFCCSIFQRVSFAPRELWSRVCWLSWDSPARPISFFGSCLALSNRNEIRKDSVVNDLRKRKLLNFPQLFLSTVDDSLDLSLARPKTRSKRTMWEHSLPTRCWHEMWAQERNRGELSCLISSSQFVREFFGVVFSYSLSSSSSNCCVFSPIYLCKSRAEGDAVFDDN